MTTLPLEDLLVVDLSQFLAGPYASLKLLDLGARVIKIEHPERGDLCRNLYLSDTEVEGDSTIFHAINRGKESLALDLKSARDLAILKKLIKKADVFLQNFRPGVIERLGLGPDVVRGLNPRIIYASVSGYGAEGPWAKLPGQDLLAQARSGAMWLNGKADDGPVPFGLPVADMFAGANILQAILAALVGRGVSGKGALVETSLLEAMVELQFEVLTTHLNDGRRPPERSASNGAHAYLAAPYGVYQTADGWLAIAMSAIDKLATCLKSRGLAAYAADSTDAFSKRDEINSVIAKLLADVDADTIVRLLEKERIWCAKVLDWDELLESKAFNNLDMTGLLARASGPMKLLRSPVRYNGIRRSVSSVGPKIGQHNEAILLELEVNDECAKKGR